ncbi:MAG: nucleoside-diphosphate kinase [Patescibacteria group bacterium]
MNTFERSLIIIKPDALQRNLLGEIIGRFERKGLHIIGLKMMRLDDVLLDAHYAHHRDKPFFGELKNFMKSSPVVIMAVRGIDAIKAVRIIVGATRGSEADCGSIRGDLAMSTQNLVHASDSVENGELEIVRFFRADELFEYKKIDFETIYGVEK